MLNPIGGDLERYLDCYGASENGRLHIANADHTRLQTRDIDFQFEFMSLAAGGTPNVVEAQGFQSRTRQQRQHRRESRLLSETAMRVQFRLQPAAQPDSSRTVRDQGGQVG